MTQSLVNFRLDSDLKQELDETCQDLGLTMTAAFTVFAKKVVRERRIPFDVSIDPFYSDTNQALLRRAAADAEANLNMSSHELIDA